MKGVWCVSLLPSGWTCLDAERPTGAAQCSCTLDRVHTHNVCPGPPPRRIPMPPHTIAAPPLPHAPNSAREALRQCLPDLLRNPQFTSCLKSDDTTRRWLAQLLVNVGFTDSAAQLSAEALQPTPLQGQ